MHLFLLTLVLIILYYWANLAAATADETPYCDHRLCANKKPHIACNNSGAFSDKCGASVQAVEITPEFVNNILGNHNEYRNKVAGGLLVRFESAKRMGTMKWDKELAYLAELNSKRCSMSTDEFCQNVLRFKTVGQNIGKRAYMGPTRGYSDEELATNIIAQWFEENSYASMNIIDEYPDEKAPPPMQKFTLMISDRNVAVGCASVRYKEFGFNIYLLTCNYATDNLKGVPVYNSGRPTEGCKTHPNPLYPNLCSEDEDYEIYL